MNEGKFIKTLTIITVVIILLNILNELLGQPSWQFDRFMNVGYEGNFPTWFSSMILAIAAFLAYKCSIVVKTKENGRVMWRLLSLGLIGMSCDEVAQIHENLGAVLNKYLFMVQNITHSSWVIVAGPFILFCISVFALRFYKYLRGSKVAGRLLLVGALIYIGGAFILEATINLMNHNDLELVWKVEIILEEACEIVGTILIIRGLFEHYKFLAKASIIECQL